MPWGAGTNGRLTLTQALTDDEFAERVTIESNGVVLEVQEQGSDIQWLLPGETAPMVKMTRTGNDPHVTFTLTVLNQQITAITIE